MAQCTASFALNSKNSEFLFLEPQQASKKGHSTPTLRMEH